MATVEIETPPLRPGDCLTRDEFLRRWEAMPNLKRAELIQGIVYMPFPLSRKHGSADSYLHFVVTQYAFSTPGCEPVTAATVLMRDDSAPQSDISLFVAPEYGGQATMAGKYLAGALELACEICYSSSDYDLREKLELYQMTGVQEYLTVLLQTHEVRWHHLVDGVYQILEPGEDGILRSLVFPGFWIDPVALLDRDKSRLSAVIQQGINSPELVAFVEQLLARGAKN